MKLPDTLNLLPPTGERFRRQLEFLVEADKIKQILRQSYLFDSSRRENDAEHSWTICLMALVFREFAPADLKMEKVLTMLLIHDLVEIDAGDTFLYAKDRHLAAEKERTAARRIFGILETDQGTSFLELWEEFEEGKTLEARFAGIFDRMEPLLQNFLTKGQAWKLHGVTKAMVMEKNRHLAQGSREIWEFLQAMVDQAVSLGYLAP